MSNNKRRNFGDSPLAAVINISISLRLRIVGDGFLTGIYAGSSATWTANWRGKLAACIASHVSRAH